jgi:hypothetical protein
MSKSSQKGCISVLRSALYFLLYFLLRFVLCLSNEWLGAMLWNEDALSKFNIDLNAKMLGKEIAKLLFYIYILFNNKIQCSIVIMLCVF